MALRVRMQKSFGGLLQCGFLGWNPKVRTTKHEKPFLPLSGCARRPPRRPSTKVQNPCAYVVGLPAAFLTPTSPSPSSSGWTGRGGPNEKGKAYPMPADADGWIELPVRVAVCSHCQGISDPRCGDVECIVYRIDLHLCYCSKDRVLAACVFSNFVIDVL
jgi:hypothetical protein